LALNYQIKRALSQQDGYEARQVAKALWVKTIMFLSGSVSNDDATERILQSMFSNALPGHEAIACVHSFLTRGLHMGALLMISCIAKHLEVPIVSLESLKRFFDSTEAPTTAEDKQTYDLIKNWLLKCANRNRFCPENPGPMHTHTNVSIYITSDGDVDATPISEKDTMLRVKKSRMQVRPARAVCLPPSQTHALTAFWYRRRTMCITRSGSGSRTSGGAPCSRPVTWARSRASTRTPSSTS
jgi:hypothetical protein